MPSKFFCQKRKYAQQSNSKAQNLCQVYQICLDLTQMPIPQILQKQTHCRREKQTTNFSNLFWSGTDELEKPNITRSSILSQEGEYVYDNFEECTHQEDIYCVKDWNKRWGEAETYEGEFNYQ